MEEYFELLDSIRNQMNSIHESMAMSEFRIKRKANVDEETMDELYAALDLLKQAGERIE